MSKLLTGAVYKLHMLRGGKIPRFPKRSIQLCESLHKEHYKYRQRRKPLEIVKKLRGQCRISGSTSSLSSGQDHLLPAKKANDCCHVIPWFTKSCVAHQTPIRLCSPSRLFWLPNANLLSELTQRCGTLTMLCCVNKHQHHLRDFVAAILHNLCVKRATLHDTY